MRPSIPPRLQSLTRPTCIGLATALLAGTGHAHDGHGLFGAHWHASDTLGFVALALAVGAALWLSRK